MCVGGGFRLSIFRRCLNVIHTYFILFLPVVRNKICHVAAKILEIASEVTAST
jgi:hypothetical protein